MIIKNIYKISGEDMICFCFTNDYLVTFASDMEWLSTQDMSHDLLVALHPPYSLVLWNADTGTKLWKKSYTDTLLSFSFDPFEPSHLACKLNLNSYFKVFYISFNIL